MPLSIESNPGKNNLKEAAAAQGGDDFKPNHFHPDKSLRDVYPQLLIESFSNPKIKPLRLSLGVSFEGAPCFSRDCRERGLIRKAA